MEGTPASLSHAGVSRAAKTVYEEEQPREIFYNDDKGCDCTELDLLMDFRQNFVKLQRQQRVPRYKEIKENKEFSPKINISGDQSISAVLHHREYTLRVRRVYYLWLHCFMYGKCLSLGIKSKNTLLSNWTRHINSSKGVRNPNTGKITILKAFFNSKTTDISCSKSKPKSVCPTKSVIRKKESKYHVHWSHLTLLL